MNLPETISGVNSGYSLPREYYTSPEVFSRDLEKIFLQEWLYAGHISQIKNPGDYFLFEFADESIIVTRTADGEVRASANVCRHRGARVMQEPCGNAKAFRCPYHNWTYELDGSLRVAPGMKDQLDGSDFGLRKVWVNVWQGFIYVNLGADSPAETVNERLAPAVAAVAGHRFEDLKIARTIHYDVPANWKLIMENYRECYHCRAAHPQFCATVPVDGLDANRGQPSTRLIKQPFGSFTQFGLREGALTQSVSGEAVSIPLGDLDREETTLRSLVFYPAHAFVFGLDYGFVFGLQPKSAVETRLTAHWYVNARAVEGKDYEAARVSEFWDLTTQQDVFLCTINQRGVNSRLYVPGPYNQGQEDDVEHFRTYYLSMFNRPDGL